MRRRIQLRGIKTVRRGAKRYVYRRVNGLLIPLPDLPDDDPRFLAAYVAAGTAAPPARSRSTPGTIGALCTAYLRSGDFKVLATITQAVFRRVVDKIGEEHEPDMSGRRKGGVKGGKARADKLSPEERSEIARSAAKARWKD